MYQILLHYTMRNIVRSKARSLFTIVSISLIINLYTILASIASAIIVQLPDAISRAQVDIFIQSKFASNPLSSLVPIETFNILEKDERVKNCNALIIGKKKLSPKASIFILGMQDIATFANRTGISVTEGRFFKSENLNEILVGSKLAKVMHYKVGDTIELSPDKFYTITGIYSTLISMLNTGVLVHKDEAQHILNKHKHVSMIFLGLQNKDSTEAFIKKFNSENKSLQASKSGELTQNFTSIQNVVHLIDAITLLTLLVAIAVMMNTFIMATSERTKEIGVLSAIGWGRSKIVAVFMLEAVVLAWISAIIGYLSAYPTIALMQKYFISLHAYLPQNPVAGIIPMLVLITTSIGAISALFPALYATKINISEAIRYE